MARHRFELERRQVKPLHCAPYREQSKTTNVSEIRNWEIAAKGGNCTDLNGMGCQILFAREKNSSSRNLWTIKKLISLTGCKSYPIPRMSQCINSLWRASTFPFLDGSRFCWQIHIEDFNCNKTAFTPHHGIYLFSCPSFELGNASGTSNGPWKPSNHQLNLNSPWHI